MDEQHAILRFFFFFYNIIPVILGRWEEDNIKLCAMEPLLDLYMYFMYQVRRRYTASICVFYVFFFFFWMGRGGSGW